MEKTKNKKPTPRELAQRKYYTHQTKYATIEQARDLTRKLPKRHNNPLEYGYLCLIQLDNVQKFYTVHYFPKWTAPNWVLGMWNEITLIERL